MEPTWECIVVGGGAAGLSAALVLGRARVSTLVVDAGEPSNVVAHGIGGLLGHDGRPPQELYEMGRVELKGYPSVELRQGRVAAGRPVDGGFELDLADGGVQRARHVVLAMGMDYRRPTLPGLEERWGRSVFHCPFCHGWEVRDQALGVLDRGPMAAHRAQLLRMWSDDVTIYSDGPGDLDPAAVAHLEQAGIRVDERPVVGLDGPGEALTGIQHANGTVSACGGLLVPVTLTQRSALAAELGATNAPPTPISADAIAVDAMYETSIPGLAAAGDLSVSMPSVANAVAAGSNAAATIVRRLVEARFGVA
jgi:thioredoxin reductase